MTDTTLEAEHSNVQPGGSDSPQIIIKDLWKIYGRDPKRILKKDIRNKSKEEIQKKTGCIVGMRNINLNIEKGQFYILMGLSGSGKSTLVRNLIRLVNPTSGSITINGKNVTKMNLEQLLQFRRNTFGMVFQHYGLLPHLTVLDNAAYGLKVKGMSKGERYAKAMRTLETVGLKGWEDYYPGSLSGGMQQRVGLARALANEPDILLMDEPFSGLDPLIRRQMQDELVELQETLKKTIIFVTHDLHEALKLGDKIAIMRNGEVVQEGTPEDIVTHPANDYVQEFVRDASPAKVLTAGSIMEEPKIILYDWEGAKTAQTLLLSNNRRSAFVVNKARKFLGITTEVKLNDLLENKDYKGGIPDSIIRKVPTVTEDTILEDMFSIVNENPYPIPVVDELGRFKGKVTTDQIFESITPYNEGDSND
ncbi:glycine betaine/L-proline ABC transporter ATP-binding protein [Oceanispirochaeta crateris]|uniref:Glycine betaine/L-proline ABC transporter ATP-binding protein n=1 Tax=Oceanispirochaeta crateris TaxID=2518645 RepID=A0A5C1QLK4_9SPIO|nr:glycine betaine/L-proline ABC transporter ATP-binding protein [Oceanispirochaeta crateris]QEN08099.1 glycine betaine/L-proline ABC transporter ATP-binding protein [Oceanispirochaeta crateris]